MLLKNFRIKVFDNNKLEYKLRKQLVTQFKILYKSTLANDFTESYDFSLDEESNCIWTRLPYDGVYQVKCSLNIGPLRTIECPLQQLNLSTITDINFYSSMPVPLNSLQGYSPRLSTEGEWLVFDDEKQAFTGTGLYAKSTTGESHPIVDYAAVGVMSAITSNYIANLQTNYNAQFAQISNVVTEIQQQSTTITINGEEQTQTGLNKTFNFSIDGLAEHRTLDSDELIGDKIYKRGSLIVPDANGGFSAASHQSEYVLSGRANQDGYVNIAQFDRSNQVHIKIQQYNTITEGNVIVTKNGYNYSFVCDSEALSNKIYGYSNGINGHLVIKGSPYMSPSVVIEGTNTFFAPFSLIGNQDYTQYVRIPFFLTSDNITATYANLDGDVEVDPTNLNIVNYNALTSLTYSFNDMLVYPISLKFVSANENEQPVVVTVKDDNGSTPWSYTSEPIPYGYQGIFTWSPSDDGETSLGAWTYNKSTEGITIDTDNLVEKVSTLPNTTEKQVVFNLADNKFYTNKNNAWQEYGGGGNATNLSAYTCQYSTTFYEAGERKIKYNDKNGTYHEDETSAQWIYPKSDSAITCTQAVVSSFWNSGAVPTIALLSGYVSEQIPVRSNELIYNGTFTVTDTSTTYVMNCIMDNDTLVDVFYKGQWVRMSRFSTKHPLLVESSECNELNVYINSANTGTFYFNGLQTNDIIQFAVRKGRCQVGIIDGSTTKAVVMQPHTIDATYETPAYYNITSSMMIVAGVRQTSTALVNPTAIDDSIIRKNMVVDINLSSSNYNIYLPNMPVARGKVTRYLLVHSTNTSSEVQFELRSTSSGYTLHSGNYSLAPNGQVLVKATYDALLATWFIG